MTHATPPAMDSDDRPLRGLDLPTCQHRVRPTVESRHVLLKELERAQRPHRRPTPSARDQVATLRPVVRSTTGESERARPSSTDLGHAIGVGNTDCDQSDWDANVGPCRDQPEPRDQPVEVPRSPCSHVNCKRGQLCRPQSKPVELALDVSAGPPGERRDSRQEAGEVTRDRHRLRNREEAIKRGHVVPSRECRRDDGIEPVLPQTRADLAVLAPKLR